MEVKEGCIPLEQGSANQSPWAKSSLSHAFVNKVLLEYSHIFVYVLSVAAFKQ